MAPFACRMLCRSCEVCGNLTQGQGVVSLQGSSFYIDVGIWTALAWLKGEDDSCPGPGTRAVRPRSSGRRGKSFF